MIQNEEQWISTRDALLHLERGLASIYRDKAKMHPDRYVLMADSFLEDILKLRQQIDDYLGVTETIRLVKEWDQAHPQATTDAENGSEMVRDTEEVAVH
jgi:hypothetical protein